ncbi:MAG: type II toxin-antitoxin system HicB family antitoxin [bacterium]
MKTRLTAVLIKEDDMYVASNPDTGVTTQGGSMDEALANLREAVGLYLEETKEKLPAREVVLASVEV